MKDILYAGDFTSSNFPGGWHRVKTSSLPYLTLADVESIYFVLNDSNSKGLQKFSEAAKKIATQVPTYPHKFAYQFKNEVALFELFQEALSQKLEEKGIDSWGRLMQYIS